MGNTFLSLMMRFYKRILKPDHAFLTHMPRNHIDTVTFDLWNTLIAHDESVR